MSFGSPAWRAGLKAGDVLAEFDGKALDNPREFTYARRSHQPSEKVMVSVLRGKERFTIEVILRGRHMMQRQQGYIFRKSALAILGWVAVLLATSALAQEKTATSGLGGAGPVVHGTADDPLRDPREKHLRHVKQLTFGGQNAEAYFSYDGRRLIFMSTRAPYACDQIFIMNTDGSGVHLESTGKGRTTCAYFYPDGEHALYSSTHLAGDACPPRLDYSHGYVWGVYSSYQMYYATDEGKILKPLTTGPGYNAEATLSADGKKIVFTSSRDGDLDIDTMNPEARTSAG